MAKEKSVPVSSIKSMAGAVPEFALPITIKRLDGTEFTLEFRAKAMGKKAWAALRDARLNAEPVETAEGEAPKFSFVRAVEEDMRKGAEMVVNCANGWDLTDEFTVANVEELEDSFGGTLAAFLSAYDAAIFQGRLGNSGK